MRSAGVERIVTFDIAAHDAHFGSTIRERARQSHTTLVDSSADLARASDIVFSTVTSSSALDAARQTVPFLEPRHIYADLNSVSPALKQDIARVVGASGARFVEVAVMAPVLPYGHRVPMLLGGPAAPLFLEAMQPFGLRMQTLAGAPVGAAAAVKMCRSIVVKGLEALMCECVLAASRFDADAHVFASLNESFPGIDWKTLADYMANAKIEQELTVKLKTTRTIANAVLDIDAKEAGVKGGFAVEEHRSQTIYAYPAGAGAGD